MYKGQIGPVEETLPICRNNQLGYVDFWENNSDAA